MNDERAPLPDRRRQYDRGSLDEGAALPDPLAQFELWFRAAEDAEAIVEPYAVSVATVSPEGQPSARIVLLRGYDERGFVFFTNYESRKGRELDASGKAALLFYWASLERQIRIEGTVVRIAAGESDAYFAKRPRGHRLSAWASKQSTIVPDRATLEAQMRAAEVRFDGAEVPRPPHWGGYRVQPQRFEFWQGRRNRVHDRLSYVLEGLNWRLLRLSP